MIIKKGQYVLFIVLVTLEVFSIIIGLFSFLLGFEISFKTIMFFLIIAFSISFFNILIYIIILKHLNTKYVFDDYCISYIIKNDYLCKWEYSLIKNAEYYKFSLHTILNQSVFGYIKITMHDGNFLIIDMSLKKALHINEKYFKIVFKK